MSIEEWKTAIAASTTLAYPWIRLEDDPINGTKRFKNTLSNDICLHSPLLSYFQGVLTDKRRDMSEMFMSSPKTMTPSTNSTTSSADSTSYLTSVNDKINAAEQEHASIMLKVAALESAQRKEDVTLNSMRPSKDSNTDSRYQRKSFDLLENHYIDNERMASIERAEKALSWRESEIERQLTGLAEDRITIHIEVLKLQKMRTELESDRQLFSESIIDLEERWNELSLERSVVEECHQQLQLRERNLAFRSSIIEIRSKVEAASQTDPLSSCPGCAAYECPCCTSNSFNEIRNHSSAITMSDMSTKSLLDEPSPPSGSYSAFVRERLRNSYDEKKDNLMIDTSTMTEEHSKEKSLFDASAMTDEHLEEHLMCDVSTMTSTPLTADVDPLSLHKWQNDSYRSSSEFASILSDHSFSELQVQMKYLEHIQNEEKHDVVTDTPFTRSIYNGTYMGRKSESLSAEGVIRSLSHLSLTPSTLKLVSESLLSAEEINDDVNMSTLNESNYSDRGKKLYSKRNVSTAKLPDTFENDTLSQETKPLSKKSEDIPRIFVQPRRLENTFNMMKVIDDDSKDYDLIREHTLTISLSKEDMETALKVQM